MKRVRSHAFTLVELLVVMGIVALLAALFLPVMGRAAEQGRATACLSNLKQVGIGLRLYLDENNNRMPVMQNRARGTNTIVTNAVEVVLARDLGNTQVLRCPSDRARWFEDTGSSYLWNFLLNGQPADHLRIFGLPLKPDGVALFSDKDNFHAARGAGRGKNHLYADGDVKSFFVLETEPAP